MSHQAVQAKFSHSTFLSTTHLKMWFESRSRNTCLKISTFTPKIKYLSQIEECLLQNGSQKVGEKYRKTDKKEIQKIQKRSFVKCGISHNVDGTEDNDINTEGIPDYKLPHPGREFEMNDSSNDEDDDEVLTECEEVVNDNESDSECDSDSDSN